MPLTWATMADLAAGYFTFLISMRSLLCSVSFACSSFDMPAPLGAAASSVSAVFVDFVPANAVEKLGTASPNANAIIQPMFSLRIGLPPGRIHAIDLVQARSRCFAVKQTSPGHDSW